MVTLRCDILFENKKERKKKETRGLDVIRLYTGTSDDDETKR